jgi:hypothetical protein
MEHLSQQALEALADTSVGPAWATKEFRKIVETALNQEPTDVLLDDSAAKTHLRVEYWPE